LVSIKDDRLLGGKGSGGDLYPRGDWVLCGMTAGLRTKWAMEREICSSDPGRGEAHESCENRLEIGGEADVRCGLRRGTWTGGSCQVLLGAFVVKGMRSAAGWSSEFLINWEEGGEGELGYVGYLGFMGQIK